MLVGLMFVGALENLASSSVGALRMGTLDADPGTPVPICRAWSGTGFGGRLKAADVLMPGFDPLFTQPMEGFSLLKDSFAPSSATGSGTNMASS